MKKIGLNELRECYLSFFEKKGHLRAPSAPLVPQGDASLLFINSGMAPLKPYFSGEVTPPCKRMTTCQKCVRTPDIENVGKTSRHGTFFEMLGNFSFGDYFKREAMTWAWEFITEVLEMPKELLIVSVYHEDDEAYELWTKEIGVSPDHMVRLGKADNFWEIGAGPCGPCSEIYFDRGEENGCHSPTCAPGCDCDRYVEFWNLVFTQYNNDGQGNYTPLASKNIDTGMGIERLACLMQGVDNLFEVHTIYNVLTMAAKLAGKTYKQQEQDDISLRVITDHIRSVTMMVCDGALPSNEGRGYVLRRLLRRAARHGRLLGISGTFLHELCKTVIQESGGAYPELIARQDYIVRVIRVEEERFEQTIDAGLRLLMDRIEHLQNDHINIMGGKEVFKLYDTYGFPFALTTEILSERGMTIEQDIFERLMEEQRNRARAARAAMGDFGWADADLGIDKSVKTQFVGYDTLVCEAGVLHVLTPEGLLPSASEGDRVTIVLDTTPFYAESGGQVADYGVLESDQLVFLVQDVRKTKDGQFLHLGEVTSGEVTAGITVTAKVDKARREAIQRAHSATHLLQKALQSVLGNHVTQAGSLVEPDRLRFDFTHFASLTPKELEDIRGQVVDMIYEDLPVSTTLMTPEDARKKGAMALFNEKYGDVVRVVSMGDYSMELCGGTHVSNTAKIGAFVTGGDSSVAAGVRRIEARLGKLVIQEINDLTKMMTHAADLLKTTPNELESRIVHQLGELKQLARSVESLKSASLRAETEQGLLNAQQVGNFHVATFKSDTWEADALRIAGDFLKDKDPSVVAAIASTFGGKLTFLVVCGKEAVAKGIKAGDIMKQICAAAGGSGGGRPDSAMGGGKDLEKLDEALALVTSFVEAKTTAL